MQIINLYPKPHAGKTTREIAVAASAIAFTGDAATLQIGTTNYITYTSVLNNDSANNITVAYVDPGAVSQSLSVSVSVQAITVSLATDSGGAITSTLTLIKAAVDALAAAAALVTTAITGTGSTVVTAAAAANLSGGAEAFNVNTPYVLLNVKSNSVYATFDASTPSSTNGVILPSGYLEVVSSHIARSAKFLQNSGAARVVGVPLSD